MKRLWVSLYMCIIAASVCAQDVPAKVAPPVVSEQDFLEDMPVVLSATRLRQPLNETPGMMTVLDREAIRASGYRTLPDLMRLVPGFNVAWLRGGWATVNYHGLSGEFSNRVLVLVDGRAINSEYWSQGVEWGAQPFLIDDVERIEVLSGSNSATYGTNAFLGVVNITTRSSTADPGGYFRSSGGNGINDTVARWSGAMGPVNARITAGKVGDSGLDYLPDNWRSSVLNARFDTKLTSVDDVTFALGAQSGITGDGYVSDIFNPPNNFYTSNNFYQLRWHRNLNAGDEFSLNVNQSQDRLLEGGLLVLPVGSVFLDQNRTASRRSIDIQHNVGLMQDLRMVWGGETRQDSVVSYAEFNTNNSLDTSTWRLYDNLEWRLTPKTTVNGGLMAERVSLTHTTVSPRLFINQEIQPGHTLRAGYSTATRSPTIFEDRANQVMTASGIPLAQVIQGNPNLRPERIETRELGYFGHIVPWNSQWNVRLYNEHLKDLIAQVNIPSTAVSYGYPITYFSYDNVNTATITGIEVQLKVSPIKSGQLTLGHSYEKLTQDNPKIAASAPKNSSSLMWHQQLGDVDYSLIYYKVDPIHWLEYGGQIDSYSRTDARIGWKFRNGPLPWEVSLIGNNLFSKYMEFRNPYPPESQLFGRRIFLTLKVRF